MDLIFLASLLAAILAAEAATLAFPVVNRIAMAIRAVDYPGGRRSQKEAIPRLGGVAIVMAIAAGAILPSLLLWRQWGGKGTPLGMGGLLGGTTAGVLVGVGGYSLGASALQT